MKSYRKLYQRKIILLLTIFRETHVQADLEEIEREEEENRKQQIEKARLKSRLFYSDRALLHNQMPQAGLVWEKNDDHHRIQ